MLTRVWLWLFPVRHFDIELTADVPGTVASLRAQIPPRGFRAVFKSGVVGRVDEGGIRLKANIPVIESVLREAVTPAAPRA